MKDYIVKNIYELSVSYNEYFLVQANTKKEAVDKVYETQKHEFNKKDFKAYTLAELYKQADTEGIYVIH